MIKLTKLYLLFLLLISLQLQAGDIKITKINPDFTSRINAPPEWVNGFEVGGIAFPIKLGYQAFVPPKATNFDAYYDLRNLGMLPPVKTQSSGGCWAYSSMSTVESRMLMLGEGLYDLSDNNLKYCHGFFPERSTYGNAWMTTAYFARQSGPLLEAQDPHPGGTTMPGEDCPVGEAPVYFIRDSRYPPNDMATIKQLIIDIGSVWSLMYINTAYFNDVDNTYYYPGTYAVNHVLNIVGWDDNKVTAGGTGAWICQNTWGAGWGENGFVYVSYSDTQILNYNAYFPNFTSYDENSRVLLYNDLGNYYSLGYSQETAYALQKHPITEHLLIEEIATYAMAFGAQIEVEIYDSFNESTGVLSGLLGSVSSTTATHPGLYTFSLDEAFSVDVGDEIFVKVKYTTPSYNFPIPIERYAEDYADPQIESGVSWVSGDGVSGNWFQIGEDVVDYKMDLCINVYASVIQDITWDGSESSDWHLAQNWDLNTTPKSYHNVVVPNLSNQPIVGNNEAADCNKLTINSGASLTLNSGSSLINQSTIINNGSIMIEKTISNGQWHYISSPVANAQSGVFNGAYLQTWEETTGAWSEITSNTILLSPLQGFAFWEEGSASNTYTFSGTPNSGNYTANLTYTQVAGEENHGANLLGNPYVSSIDWSVLDDTYGAVYYWDGSIGPLGNYVEWNNGVGGGEANIPPMQGFFIVTDAPATFNLSNAHRTHVGAANFYKSAQRASQSLVISASDNWNADELYMVWNSQATNGFDMAHDAYKFLSQNQGQSQIYSINQDVKFAIDVRPENEEIQLGFSNNQNGVYGISLKEINNIGVVILEDTKLGIFYDLQKNDYSFSWDITDAATRFKLHFETTAIEELEHPSKIYAYGKTIVISCVLQNQNAYLQLYNISGQMVFKQALKGKEIIIPSIINGVYFVQLVSEDFMEMEKVILID